MKVGMCCGNGVFCTKEKKAKYKIGEQVYFFDIIDWTIKKGTIIEANDFYSVSMTSFGGIIHENPYQIERKGKSYFVREGFISRTKEDIAKEYKDSEILD